MRLLPWIAALPAVLLLAAACGDGPDDDGTPEPSSSASVTADFGATPTRTVEPTRVPPTPVPATGFALSVAGGGKVYQPTVEEFRGLPTTEITAGGEKRKGVTLAEIASKVEGTKSFITIEGLRADLRRDGAIRYPLADVGTTTVLVLNDQGHIDLYSSSVPEAEWLRFVSGIALN